MRLKANFKYSLLKGEGVILFEENGTSTLWSGVYEYLIPLLDGTKSIKEIVELLTYTQQVQSSNIYKAIFLLSKKGYLSVNTNNLNEGEAAFWSHYNISDPVSTRKSLNKASVNIINFSHADDLLLKDKLIKVGLNQTEITDENCVLTILLCESYLDSSVLDEIVKLRNKKQNIMLIRPIGNEVWIGPIYILKEKGCHNCFITFHSRHNQAKVFASNYGNNKTNILSPSISLNSIHEIAFSIAAHEVLKFISIKQTTLTNNIISFDSQKLSIESHRFFPFNNCKICNTVDIKNRYPLELKSCTVNFTADGGHRQITPEETMLKYGIYISKISGLVDVISELKTPMPEVYVFMAGYNSTRQVKNLNSLKANLRSRNGGKGKTKIQAKVSALCESIERYSNEIQGDEVVINASYSQMDKKYPGKVIFPNDVMLFSENQFKKRDQLNLASDNFNQIPSPLKINEKIGWSPVWSITNKCEKYLPTQFLFFYYSKEKIIAIQDSNGLSSGNTLEESIIQGFFEVVERDCAAIWWYNRLNFPEVDLSKSKDKWIRKIKTSFKEQSRDIWCLDITNDLKIPCFAAISKSNNDNNQKILVGLGCHFDAEIALQRSIAELNQMLAYSGNLENWFSSEDEIIDHTSNWLMTATIEKHPYLLPDKNKDITDINNFPNISTGDLFQDILICNNLIKKLESEILVSDVTRDEISMSVVKVIVPKLRHFYARFAPGRLYDIPVKMGWLTKPKKELEMNPTSMFF